MRYIHVKVIAGARKEFIKPRRMAGQESSDHFEISVREKAERNMANARVLELVANHFKLVKGKVRIVNGHHHASKLIAIE